MNTKTTKGNHEFSTTHLPSAVCGGSRQRKQHSSKTVGQRKHVLARAGSRHRDTAGADQQLKANAGGSGAAIGAGARPGRFLSPRMESRDLQFVIDACGGVRLSGSAK